MDIPNISSRRSPADIEAEEVAGHILAIAEFWGSAKDEAGNDVQIWKLRKSLRGCAVGSLIARPDLVSIIRRSLMKPRPGR